MGAKETAIASVIAASVASTNVSAQDKVMHDQLPLNAPPVKMIFQSATNAMDQAFEMSHKALAPNAASDEAKFQTCLDTATGAFTSPVKGMVTTIDHIESSSNIAFEFIAPNTSQDFLQAATNNLEKYLQQCTATYSSQEISTEQSQKIEEAHTQASQEFIERYQPLGQHESFTNQAEIIIPKVNIPSTPSA